MSKGHLAAQGRVTSGKGTPAADLRNREIAKIKIGCGPKGLALDDDTYRALLERLTGKRSAADLDWRERARVINYLAGQKPGAGRKAANARANEWAFIDNAPADCQPMLRKILMLTRAAGIERGKQVRYAEGIARQMAGVNASCGPVTHPLRMCSYTELWRIVAALGKHVERLNDKQQQPEAVLWPEATQ